MAPNTPQAYGCCFISQACKDDVNEGSGYIERKRPNRSIGEMFKPLETCRGPEQLGDEQLAAAAACIVELHLACGTRVRCDVRCCDCVRQSSAAEQKGNTVVVNVCSQQLSATKLSQPPLGCITPP